MKKNTQKILLSLYSPSNTTNHRIKLRGIDLIVPDLTDGGRRSLIHVLKTNGMINVERVLGVTSVNITQYGNKQLEVEFPALSSKWDQWQGNWDCLAFVKAPKSDKQFRYLRKLLVSEGAISISRGVYISPNGFSNKVVSECNELYRESILMFSVGEWKIASLRNLIVEKYGLLDFVETYSGISNDVNRLLTMVNSKNSLIESYKLDINLAYDRLRDMLKEDPGFCHYYFNEIPKIKSILKDLNSIILRY
ncbi:MAG: hypothetical protein H6772_03790 [Pseudomonadales bacterium]|nr:hypothetical protein [Pseudomonadales bacterium]